MTDLPAGFFININETGIMIGIAAMAVGHTNIRTNNSDIDAARRINSRLPFFGFQ